MKRTERKNRKMKKPFLLSWRKLWIAVVSGFVAIILHNLFYAIFKIEEPVFFIIATLIVPAYIIISSIYSIIHLIRKKNSKSKSKRK